MITKPQFLLRQPAAPEETSTDKFYFDLCNTLITIAKERNLFPSYPEKVKERAALCLIGYYQDVICDAGIWRSFINENRRLYGFTVPFFSTGEEYTDYELNEADVKFMVWYALSMNYENRRVWNPLDPEITEGAVAWFEELAKVYDEAPIPEDYSMAKELEIHSKEDAESILKLGTWLFLHCYLMTPAFAMTLAEYSAEYDLNTEEGVMEMQKRLEISMGQDPTGPLALYLGEWLYLIIEGKTSPGTKQPVSEKEHKYYTLFTKYTGGKVLQYFATYEEMNRFFIEALGWEPDEQHLSQVKNDKDFVLMVDPQKGMLLARNVAKCIADPDNTLYDKTYATAHSIDLLTERGRCPGDLLRYVCEKGWLPDAVFPDTTDSELVKSNWDFIARCYLQGYYRGD